MGIVRQRTGKLDEIGSTGLSTWGGYIEQAYIPELAWPRVASTYNRIWRSDPEVTIARNLYGALAGKVTVGWEFPTERGNKELPKPSKADEEFLDFLYSNNDDMTNGIGQWVADCITRTPFYGYGLWETVLGMRRKGWKGDDGWTSQENDGLIGIRNLALRDPATFYKWEMDDRTGRATGWWQQDPPNPLRELPLKRCIHMLYGDMSNPEGLATLEAMYRLERFKHHLEVIEGIGFEHTAGFLYFEADRPLTDQDKPYLRDAARYVLMAQEGGYLAMPGGIKAMFIDTPFGAAAQILEAIKHYSVLKLALLGLQFVAVGIMTGTGSYALADDSSSVAMLMYNSMTAGFARQAGTQIVDQLLRANPGAFAGITRKPDMTISPITKSAALAELAQFAQTMNAIRSLGDDDLVSIREMSGVLPVTLPPEVKEVPAPEKDEPRPDEPEKPVANEGDKMTTPGEGEPGELMTYQGSDDGIAWHDLELESGDPTGTPQRFKYTRPTGFTASGSAPDEGDNVAMMLPFEHLHLDLSGPAQTGDKDIDPELKRYYGELDTLSRQAIAGEIDRKSFEEQARDIVIAAMLLAFALGGGDPKSPDARLTVASQRVIALKSVDDLAADLYSGKFSEQSDGGQVVRTKKRGLELLALRLGLFTVTAYGLYNIGKTYLPDGIKKVTLPDGTVETVPEPRRLKWKRGPTEQGCRDCIILDEVVLTTHEWRRLYEAGLYPQSHDLKCNGYNCLCSRNETEEESAGIDNVLKRLGV